jgi:hypothetical protein
MGARAGSWTQRAPNEAAWRAGAQLAQREDEVRTLKEELRRAARHDTTAAQLEQLQVPARAAHLRERSLGLQWENTFLASTVRSLGKEDGPAPPAEGEGKHHVQSMTLRRRAIRAEEDRIVLEEARDWVCKVLGITGALSWLDIACLATSAPE